MTEQERYEERKAAIHLKRSGLSSAEVSRELKRSVSWVDKWWGRYQAEGWVGLHSRSRAPKNQPNQLPV
jgi:transposase